MIKQLYYEATQKNSRSPNLLETRLPGLELFTPDLQEQTEEFYRDRDGTLMGFSLKGSWKETLLPVGVLLQQLEHPVKTFYQELSRVPNLSQRTFLSKCVILYFTLFASS